MEPIRVVDYMVDLEDTGTALDSVKKLVTLIGNGGQAEVEVEVCSQL